jgi:hypothetical protein
MPNFEANWQSNFVIAPTQQTYLIAFGVAAI